MQNLISVYITATVIIVYTCFLQTVYTNPKEQRKEISTNPRSNT